MNKHIEYTLRDEDAKTVTLAEVYGRTTSSGRFVHKEVLSRSSQPI